MPHWNLPRLFALALALAALAASAAGGGARAEGEAERPLVVKIHADWCGICQQIEPTWRALEQELGGRARMVVLDVTDREAIAAAEAEAERLGIRDFFDAYKSSTGTVGVLRASGEPVRVLRAETDPAAYEAAVEEATAGGAGSRS